MWEHKADDKIYKVGHISIQEFPDESFKATFYQNLNECKTIIRIYFLKASRDGRGTCPEELHVEIEPRTS